MTSEGTIALDLILLVIAPAALGIWLSIWLGDFAKRRGVRPLGVRAVRIAIWCTWIAVAIWGMTVALGPLSLPSTLTISAVTTIAITLALQTTLQNIISGFVLLRGRFLRLGDSILFGGVKGTVVSIGLIEVVLRTDSGAIVVVSNSNLLSGPMVNSTAGTRLQGEY